VILFKYYSESLSTDVANYYNIAFVNEFQFQFFYVQRMQKRYIQYSGLGIIQKHSLRFEQIMPLSLNEWV